MIFHILEGELRDYIQYNKLDTHETISAFIYYSLVLIIDYLILTLINYIMPNLPFLKNGHVSTYIGAFCKFLLFLMILGVKKTCNCAIKDI